MSLNTSPAAASSPFPHPEILAMPLDEPRRPYSRPADLLGDESLDAYEKKEILSFWASDACAVESAPALRHLPGTPSPVSIDEIMRALVDLDGARPELAPGRRAAPVFKAKPQFGRFAW